MTQQQADFIPAPETGLTQAEAERRAAAGQSNTAEDEAGESTAQVIAKHLFTYFNGLNLLLAICLLLVGSYRNMLFLGVVVSNTLIGVVQELRARATVRRLSLLNAPVAHALRDGREVVLNPAQLVLGDCVVLRAGDQIPADAEVVSGTGAADESLLTGESDAIQKQPGDPLLSGSFLTEGRLIARLTRVGSDAYAARLTQEAKRIRRPKSALMTDLNRLIHLVSLLLLPIGLLMMAKMLYLRHLPLQRAVPVTVGAMVGMIPEGLILLTSVALAVGVVRLGRKQTLVQELYGIEGLARADVLCLDKTGTLTTGDMQVEQLLPVAANQEEAMQALAELLGSFECATPTLRALASFCPPASAAPVQVLPFSSKRKMSAAAFADGHVLMLGAAGFVPADAASVAPLLAEHAALGRRVLLLAEGTGRCDDPDLRADRILALVAISDTLRPNAAETLAYFRDQQVTLKIISGDDPRTVSAIARSVGFDRSDAWVDASALDDEALAEAAETAAIFGRVTPERKQLLVKALKAKGHSVAMTGDGVNDIPALKAADCSIAMGSGADATRRIAQLTLLNGDFAALPDVVAEGRRVVGNVTRTSSLFLVKTLYSFAISLLVLLFPMQYPFQPIQLTLISTLSIGTPGFFLALEPNRDRIRGRFLQQVLMAAVPGALSVVLTSAAAMSRVGHGLTAADASTVAVLVAGAMGLGQLASVCLPLTGLRAAVLGLMTAAMAAAVLLLPQVFFLTVRTLPALGWRLAAGLTLAGFAVMVLARYGLRHGLKHKLNAAR